MTWNLGMNKKIDIIHMIQKMKAIWDRDKKRDK